MARMEPRSLTVLLVARVEMEPCADVGMYEVRAARVLSASFGWSIAKVANMEDYLVVDDSDAVTTSSPKTPKIPSPSATSLAPERAPMIVLTSFAGIASSPSEGGIRHSDANPHHHL